MGKKPERALIRIKNGSVLVGPVWTTVTVTIPTKRLVDRAIVRSPRRPK